MVAANQWSLKSLLLTLEQFDILKRMTSSLNEGGTAVFRPSFGGLVLFLGGNPMKAFQVKQKFLFIGGWFTISDDLDLPSYQVGWSFLKIPKTFTISDGTSFTAKKPLTFLKSRYHVQGLDMTVKGNIWDWDFSLQKGGHEIATISQNLSYLTFTYTVDIYDKAYSDLATSLVIAIDYVKEQRTKYIPIIIWICLNV